MREKFTATEIISEVRFQENKVISFDKKNSTTYSFRVLEGGFIGIHYQEGEMSDEEGYALAEKNLELKRPYKFDVETGVRHRDKTEKVLSDKELLDVAREAVRYISEKYPDFSFVGSFSQRISLTKQENGKGLNYSNKDCSVSVNFSFKHKDSKDITDGAFGLSDRNFDVNMLYEMADNYLSNYDKELELPEEIVLQTQYYGLIGKLKESLDSESLSLGTSLLSGKIGQKVFADDFSLIHDVSDEVCWHSPFFDGEGVVLENDKLPYIENGVVLRGYADKRIADKFGVEHTGSAWRSFADVPSNGNVNFQIDRSKKTIKELLGGRKTIILLAAMGGGFNDKGEYVMPVQKALLSDGEKILGRLKEFTLVSSMFQMFGEDFIGVGSDKPIFHDKSVLIKMGLGK